MKFINLKIGDKVYHEGCFGIYVGPFIVKEINANGNATIMYEGCLNEDYKTNNEKIVIKYTKSEHANFFEEIEGWGGFWCEETPEILNQIFRSEMLRLLWDESRDEKIDWDMLTNDQLKRIKEILDESHDEDDN